MDKVTEPRRVTRGSRRQLSSSEILSDDLCGKVPSFVIPTSPPPPNVNNNGVSPPVSVNVSGDRDIFSVSEIPAWGGEEVVLNRRGTQIGGAPKKRKRGSGGGGGGSNKKKPPAVVKKTMEKPVEEVSPPMPGGGAGGGSGKFNDPQVPKLRRLKDIAKLPRPYHSHTYKLNPKDKPEQSPGSSSSGSSDPRQLPVNKCPLNRELKTYSGPSGGRGAAVKLRPPVPVTPTPPPSTPDVQAPAAPQPEVEKVKPPVSNTTSNYDQLRLQAARKAQAISFRLRNILKSSKSHIWVLCEWFYSDIDHALFSGDNDFQTCLRDRFPNLKTRNLRRAEWNLIRKKLGAPRLLSPKFFEEERLELQRRRQKIRVIQQKRSTTATNCTDLPDRIPQMITMGSKVTAILRTPRDGIFFGVVEAVDVSNGSYRVRFDGNLGTFSVPDFEVRSIDPPDCFTPRKSLRLVTIGDPDLELLKNLSDKLPRFTLSLDGVVGAYPLRFLEMIVRLRKLLKIKKEKTQIFKDLNGTAEKNLAIGQPYPLQFRLKYAKFIRQLTPLNELISKLMESIQIYSKQISPPKSEGGVVVASKLVDPQDVLTDANKAASIIVSTSNLELSGPVQNPGILSRVEQVASLLLQVQRLASEPGYRRSYELSSVRQTLQKMKASLQGQNLEVFRDRVEIPVNRILAGLV